MGTAAVHTYEVPEKTKGGFETMMKNLKKVISTVAAVAMLASTASVFALDFPDVDESASYANAVEALTALDVINGDDNGLFNPDNAVTRAEFAKMVVEALGEGGAAASSTYTKFADTQGHWAAGYVEAGVSAGFINGYDDDTFGPDDTVQYAQAVKMLVGAVGYDSYASKQGGWPSGYLSYGSSLDIINGVSVASNETELTRAQCAVLIYNAMKAPRCIIDGYDISYTGEYIPKYDVKDGEGKEWQTLLTKRNAYVVKGRVMETSKSVSTLEEDEVTFRVESADNFDGAYYKAYEDNTGATTGAYNVTAKVGSTDADDMLFTYAEAILALDKDTDEWTIVSITPYGKSETVSFAADDVDVDDAASIAANKIAVFKSETSKNTTKYTLSANPVVYVNGVEAEGEVLADAIADYIDGNKVGTVTLVDSTKTASTSVDGKYDYVMITYYESKVVDSVIEKSDSIKVNFTVGKALTIDLDNDDVTVKFTKDGEVIAATELAEDDVLSIAYDKVNGDMQDSSFIDAQVSDAKVSGVATGRSTKDNTLTIDGTAYELIEDVSGLELNTEYTLYLDVFGYAVDYEVGTANKNMGIVVAMYKQAGNDKMTVRMITTDGEVKELEAKDTETTDAIYDQIFGTTSATTAFYKGDVATAGVEKAVIEYQVQSGKLKYKAAVDAANSNNSLEYKASTVKLGSYSISETATKILDLDAYLNKDGEVGTLTVDTFEDETVYNGYVFDKNTKTGDYNFAIITNGLTSLRPESTVAVVMEIGSETEVDGTNCTSIVVAREGEEDIEVLVEDITGVAEGSVVSYAVGSQGYVEDGDINVIFTPAATYDDMLDAIAGATSDFTALAGGKVTKPSGFDNYTINVGTPSEDVEVYYGPVLSATSKSIEMFKKAAAGKSSVNETESFSIAGANIYTYDYSNKADKGLRVSVGAASQNLSVFKNSYADAEKTEVKWAEVIDNEVDPLVAFVKVVDGDVTDVVFFLAD